MSSGAAIEARKQLGSWYTPVELIAVVVDGVLDGFDEPRRRCISVLDPACGDGRFLTAVGDRLADAGYRSSLTGCDIDRSAVASITDRRIHGIHADALEHDWGSDAFDIVVGNPPFLSQMASSTTRGGSSRHGGGPYADAAAEFLSLAVRLAHPDHGRVGLVLPQSILGARDAEPVRRHVADQAALSWSWWARRQQHFDAKVNVCVVGLRRPATGRADPFAWTSVVTERLGVPRFDTHALHTDGTLGDRADLNANFRDEYYALVPAVDDDADGPPLVTSGLIDPGACLWGRRRVRFAKRHFEHPRVDLDRLDGRFPAWAERKLVPKVLIANQTRIIEAVADPDGRWLPGVPVTTATPTASADVWEICAVLTSPVAAIGAWHHGAGTGLSTTSVRVGPVSLASTPWPAGPLTDAVAGLRDGDVERCARSVLAAYGLEPPAADPLISWWSARLPCRADGT
ncbi:N-6 DNA methylase [Ilumatobacter sp.]|uniref:N-6 DNA methylase n=1 Tax=Ilumatobacter sp. TaxID=1967498 RepID=UPI003AF6ECCD